MLTANDIDILLEAMELWEDHVSDEFSTDISKSMMANFMGLGNEEETRRLFVAGFEKTLDASKPRKETSILLKARLIQMRDTLLVQESINEVQNEIIPAV